MKSSYKEDDVIILLKDITGLVSPMSTEQREKNIQKGVHYCEMLPIEYTPSKKYLQQYYICLENYSKMTAEAVKNVSEKIIYKKGKDVVLVSLARAGIPAGILIKRYIKNKYKINVFHYSISIIRGRGIDHNALKYILKRHKPENIQFVDGWTGKGAILNELKKEILNYNNIESELAVISDPAYITDICGTHDDFIIPSSCLNSTVSGLISRTFLRSDIIGKEDFHGAVYYENLENEDLSYDFIEKIEKEMDYNNLNEIDDNKKNNFSGINEVEKIAKYFDIKDINLIKPGIGETTRVLLRRVPWKILVNDFNDILYLKPILRLAEEKNVEVIQYPMNCYRSCGIIKNMSSDL